MRLSAAILLFTLCLSSAWAKDDRQERNPWLFIGADGGLTSVKSTVANESNTKGSLIDIKLLGSYYWTNFVGDAGFGWLYNKISRTTGSQSLQINTRAGFFELSPRYRFDSNWQLGLTGDYIFGTDLSFSQTVGTGSKAIFVGPHLVYEFPSASNLMRITARALIDASTSPRQVFAFQLGFQFGFPLGKKSTGYEEPRATPVPTPVPLAEKKPELKLNLSVNKIHFDTGSSELKGKSRQLMIEIGKFLAKHPDAWGKLLVAGHTDNRGSYKLNLDLSQARSDSVKAALGEGGAPDDKVEATGFSFNKPLDKANNEAAWAKNRRVELWFYQVPDSTLLESGIEKIKKRLGADSQ